MNMHRRITNNRRVAANTRTLNKQSRTADKGQSSNWGGGGVGRGAKNFTLKNRLLRNVSKGLAIGGLL
jgi:hypothetical protein